ncbi:hypothetical protein [Actinoplanes sp. M2I2]|uniref:hypothetical protein n=1 Tax=Actinoplanes sp. M2I2 TaxID=1734444 RepID=UPI002020EB3A|nr:hypothetical protein [Actinoplanes sp. M2I2]
MAAVTAAYQDAPRLTVRQHAVVKELTGLADRHQWRAKILWFRRYDQPTDAIEVQIGPHQPEPLEHATVTWSYRRSGIVTVCPGWRLDLELADAYITAYRERRARSRYGLRYDDLEGIFHSVTGTLP